MTNLERELKQKNRKESAVDTAGNETYSLATGIVLDSLAGMSPVGVLTSRASATALNIGTGALYGKWRNLIFRKTEKLRKNHYVKEALRKGFFYGASLLAGLTATSNQGYSEIADYLVDTEKAQDALTDLVAFNTFQVPVYATALSIGSLVSEGNVNLDKVKHGAGYLATISPFIGPTMGWYMDRLRKLFKLESAPEKARIKFEQGGKDGSCN